VVVIVGLLLIKVKRRLRKPRKTRKRMVKKKSRIMKTMLKKRTRIS